MITSALLLTSFFFIFILIQIYSFKLYNFHFLRKGRDVHMSSKSVAAISALVVALFLYVTIFVLTRGVDSLITYFYTFLFIICIFFTTFFLLPVQRVALRTLLSLTVASLLVSITVLLQLPILNNILIAASLLWVSPTLIKKLNIKKEYLLLFFAVFTIFDVYNVLFLRPDISSLYQYAGLSSYVEFGRYMLGMGDFFLAYLAVGELYASHGQKKALILTILMVVPLLVLNLFPVGVDIPYSVFITIPFFIMEYFSRGKVVHAK
jgi:hypothetical protein